MLGIPMYVVSLHRSEPQTTALELALTLPVPQFTPCRVRCFQPPRRKHLRSPHKPADYAITHNLTPFVSMQNHYSLLYREEEREMFPTLKVSRAVETSAVPALTECYTTRCSASARSLGRPSREAC